MPWDVGPYVGHPTMSKKIGLRLGDGSGSWNFLLSRNAPGKSQVKKTSILRLGNVACSWNISGSDCKPMTWSECEDAEKKENENIEAGRNRNFSSSWYLQSHAQPFTEAQKHLWSMFQYIFSRKGNLLDDQKFHFEAGFSSLNFFFFFFASVGYPTRHSGLDEKCSYNCQEYIKMLGHVKIHQVVYMSTPHRFRIDGLTFTQTSKRVTTKGVLLE
jgi:hypothetical protein